MEYHDHGSPAWWLVVGLYWVWPFTGNSAQTFLAQSDYRLQLA